MKKEKHIAYKKVCILNLVLAFFSLNVFRVKTKKVFQERKAFGFNGVSWKAVFFQSKMHQKNFSGNFSKALSVQKLP